MFDPYVERVGADPHAVQRLLIALEDTLLQSVSDETSQADVLSALFTLLRNILLASRRAEDPKDHGHNAAEISRVLMDFLVEFGAAPDKVH